MGVIKIVDHIDLNEAFRMLQEPEAGAISLFIGTVRNHAYGKGVNKLDFEAYEPMALKVMEDLGKQTEKQWPVKKLLMVHAVGEKQVGEPVVVIGIATPHRNDAFEACRFLIDELKKKVPIWKKEYFEDDTVWVNAHP